MSKRKKIYQFFILINVFAWISLPVLGWSGGDWLHERPDTASIMEGRAIFLALNDVDSDALPELSEESAALFFNLHIKIPSPDDQTHIHGMIDNCCSSGGLVCDGGLTFGSHTSVLDKIFLTPYDNSVLNLDSVDGPPLFHPPKPQS